jgi:hypothetical protein
VICFSNHKALELRPVLFWLRAGVVPREICRTNERG